MKRKTYFSVTVMILVSMLVGCTSVGPLCKSDEKVRASILKQTPLGSSSDDVYAVIKKQRWRVRAESRHQGFMMRRPGLNETHSVEVGTSFVSCVLGTTHFVYFPFETTKYAYWGFNKDGRLIDVWVDQDTDAL